MKIGYERDTYAEQRLFLNKLTNAEYIKVNSYFNASLFPNFTSFDITNSSYVDSKDVDIIHYFNQVNFGSTPFITTFETRVPRSSNTENFKIMVNEIIDKKCKKLIAFSNATYNIQKEYLESVVPQFASDILGKTIVLHPPQELIPNDITRFFNIKELKMIFVGGDFIHKGGIPMLKALKNIRKRYNIKLFLISDLKIRNNITKSSEKDIEYVRKFIIENKSWITYFKRLPNNEVLKLMTQSHIGLLPTLAETYGYSTLEMQAAGVPCITTDIRAQNEINPPSCGWKIELPYKNFLPKDYDINELYILIQIKIEKIIESILNNKDLIIEKSYYSIKRIHEEHNPKTYAKRLENIYKGSL